MELSRDEEDKDEQITIPYESSMQPIKKLEGLSGNTSLSGNRWSDLSHRSLPNHESQTSIKENEFPTIYEVRRRKGMLC